MADHHAFGATNDERTCLWCGHNLRPHYETPSDPRDWNERYMARARGEKVPRGEIVGYGIYQEGLFCSLRCGYQFAATLAREGTRLVSKWTGAPR